MRVVDKLRSVFDLLKNIRNAIEFKEPTPIQKLAIPAVLKGEDTLIIGETGSGKTEAAMFPIFNNIIGAKPISALYITPLRALNRDIFRRLIEFGEKIGVTVEVRHGDTPEHFKRLQVKDPPQVIITTPETFQGMLVGKRLRELLRNVKHVVIDEVHEIVTSKRGAQLALGLKRLEKIANFQLICLSATVGSPEVVASYFSRKMKTIRAKTGKKFLIDVKAFPSAEERVNEIVKIVNGKGTLIFTNTRAQAELLTSKLKEKIEVEVHHGSLSKEHRKEVEERFKRGELKAVVATSSLELGIDIGHVEQVIQYGSPRRAETLLQRIGRSGHKFGKVARGFIICDPYEEPESLVIKEMVEKGEIEKTEVVEDALDVLAHQLVGLALEENEVKLEKAFNLVKSSYPYRNLTWQEFLEVLKVLEELRLIKINKDSYRRRKKAWRYYATNVSMIPDEVKYLLIDLENNKRIALLDEDFVVELRENDRFIVAGKAWRLVKIEENRVYAVKAGEALETASWVGELIPVEFEVARKIPEVLENNAKDLGEYRKNEIYIEKEKEFTVLLNFAGNRVNNAIAHVIGSFYAARFGEKVEVKADHLGIVFRGIDPELALRYIKPELIEQHIRRSITFARSFYRRFLHVARRFGVVERGARFDKFSIERLYRAWRGSAVEEEAIREVLREKMDVKNAIKFLKMLKKGELKIVRRKISPLAKYLLAKYYPQIFEAEIPKKEIIREVYRRLASRKFPLYCLYCKSRLGNFSFETAPEACPKCGARYISVVEDPRILRKKELDVKEKREIQKIKLIGNLWLSYGKLVLLALAGRGIGPKTAARILAKTNKIEEIVAEVIKAERTYIRTRMFWKD